MIKNIRYGGNDRLLSESTFFLNCFLAHYHMNTHVSWSVSSD